MKDPNDGYDYDNYEHTSLLQAFEAHAKSPTPTCRLCKLWGLEFRHPEGTQGFWCREPKEDPHPPTVPEVRLPKPAAIRITEVHPWPPSRRARRLLYRQQGETLDSSEEGGEEDGHG